MKIISNFFVVVLIFISFSCFAQEDTIIQRSWNYRHMLSVDLSTVYKSLKSQGDEYDFDVSLATRLVKSNIFINLQFQRARENYYTFGFLVNENGGNDFTNSSNTQSDKWVARLGCNHVFNFYKEKVFLSIGSGFMVYKFESHQVRFDEMRIGNGIEENNWNRLNDTKYRDLDTRGIGGYIDLELLIPIYKNIYVGPGFVIDAPLYDETETIDTFPGENPLPPEFNTYVPGEFAAKFQLGIFVVL